MNGDFQIQSIFGGADNTSQLLPGEWDPGGADTSNVGEVLRDGILGTVQRAINAAVGEKYQDGQLTATGQRTARVQQQQSNFMMLLLIVGAVYLVAKA